MKLSERLKAARRHAQLTQKALAEKAGVEQPLISQIERGVNLKSSHTARLARACGVDPYWLETGQGSMEIVPASERPRFQGRQLLDPVERAIKFGGVSGVNPYMMLYRGFLMLPKELVNQFMERENLSPEDINDLIHNGDSNESVMALFSRMYLEIEEHERLSESWRAELKQTMRWFRKQAQPLQENPSRLPTKVKLILECLYGLLEEGYLHSDDDLESIERLLSQFKERMESSTEATQEQYER